MRTITLAVWATLLFACHKTENPVSGTCDASVTVSADAFKNTTTNTYTISNVTVNQNCLEITISASGCSGASWETQLIDAATITNAVLPSRSVKLFLTNKELCLAMVTKKQSFDITPLQLPGTKKVILQLDGWDKPIEYNYPLVPTFQTH